MSTKADHRFRRGDGWLAAAAVVALTVVVFFVVKAAQEPEGIPSFKCPALTGGMMTGGRDFLDGFVWNGVEYQRNEVFTRSWIRPPPRIGKQLTTVGCSLPELTDEYVFDIERGPWPDRTATLMRTGSPVYVIRGFNHTCRIAVHDEGEWKNYAAWDFDSLRLKSCL